MFESILNFIFGSVPPYSLDIATALSVIVAAIVFVWQSFSQKHSDRRTEKWNLQRKMADKIYEYKSKIWREILHRNDVLVLKKKEFEEKFKEKEFQLEQDEFINKFREDCWNEIEKLVSTTFKSLNEAYYYAEYDLQTQAKMIDTHYKGGKLIGMVKSFIEKIKSLFRTSDQGPQIGITEQVESFRTEVENIKCRLKDSVIVQKNLFSVPDGCFEVFLNDVGFHTLGDMKSEKEPDFVPENDTSKLYKDMSEKLKRIDMINREYLPRQFLPMEDRPPRVFEVLDKFADSVAETVKSKK